MWIIFVLLKAIEKPMGIAEIVLIVLKAFGMIEWSWWVIFIPEYIGIVCMVLGAIGKKMSRRRG